MTKQEADKEAHGGREMTDLDELKALHKRWCLGNDKAAETVFKRLPDLIDRVEKAETALNDAASKLLTFEREFNRHRMHYGSLEQNDKNKVAEYRAGLMERMASKAHDAARTASRARGGKDD